MKGLNVNFTFNDNYSAALQKLSDDVSEKILRSAARAGALVFYDLIHKNAPSPKTGNLQRAIYHKFLDQESTKTKKSYRVGVNHIKAPHWYWLEYGHISAYAVKKDSKTGEFVTLVRPEKMGTTPPGRRASKEAKDAYYVLRKNGPVFIPGTAFVRRSYDEGMLSVKNAITKRAAERFKELMINPNLVVTDVD